MNGDLVLFGNFTECAIPGQQRCGKFFGKVKAGAIGNGKRAVFHFQKLDLSQFIEAECLFDKLSVLNEGIQMTSIILLNFCSDKIGYMKFIFQLEKWLNQIDFQKINQDAGIIHKKDHEAI